MHRQVTVFVLAILVASGVVGSHAQVKPLVPVTDQMLQRPSPNDWINWRRTLDGWGYSPLKQIDRNNAGQLQPAWSASLSAGGFEPTPLVYNGIMYVPDPLSGVVALDATTGDRLWTFHYDLESQPPPPYYEWSRFTGMRNLAIYDDKIILATRDAHLVALNAVTGTVMWDQAVADYRLGYRYSSGAIIAKGVIVAGMAGCERYKRDVCFISGHDAKTGKQLWRTATVALPNTPGGDTWGDLAPEFRAGGDAWIPGSYDPGTNLVYWSTAQPKPWARISRGTDGDALYTNSVLALDPTTGKIKWYHQLLPGDSHDMDEVFENILIDHDGRKSLFKMGKLGILWELDRETGKFVRGTDLGFQNLVDFNVESGKVTYRPNMLPTKFNEPITMCPGTGGIKNWRALAYDPDTRAVYVPVSLSCQIMEFIEVPRTVGGTGRPYGDHPLGTAPNPLSPEQRGQFVAMDVATGRVLWRHTSRANTTSAALTTGGGLAIVGDADRNLYIHDSSTGRVVHQMTLPGVAGGFPITYAVNGQQYLAVASIDAGKNSILTFRLPQETK